VNDDGTPDDDNVVELKPGQRKRKRLSTIDVLPADIRRELDAAIEEGRLSVDDLWALVHNKGGDVSRSAVGRYKVREERALAVFRQSQEMAKYFAQERERDPHGPVSQLNNELLKSTLFQRLMSLSPKDAEKASPKDLSLLASAVQRAASTDKITTEREILIAKRAVEKERRKQESALTQAEKKGEIDPTLAQRAREIMFGR
jgi:hypothetical protein